MGSPCAESKFIQVRNVPPHAKCLAFRLSIGLDVRSPLAGGASSPGTSGIHHGELGGKHLDDTLCRFLLVDAVEPVEMVRPARSLPPLHGRCAG